MQPNFYWKDNLESESNGYDLIDLEGTEIAIDQNDYETMEIRVELNEQFKSTINKNRFISSRKYQKKFTRSNHN